jgi:hypothetical protein
VAVLDSLFIHGVSLSIWIRLVILGHHLGMKARLIEISQISYLRMVYGGEVFQEIMILCTSSVLGEHKI